MTREQILNQTTRKTQPVSVPEWDMTVNVVRMSAAEKDAMDAESFSLKEAGKSAVDNYRARTLVRALRDQDGKRIFADDDAEALGQLDTDVIKRLYDVAKELNGLGAEAEEQTAKK